MRVYLAQCMDDLAYYEHYTKLCKILEENGHSVYHPWRDEGVILEDKSTLEESLRTFNNDVNNIKTCDVMVACIDGLGPDSGTCVETGIAYALNKPVILYTTEFKFLKEGTNINDVYPAECLPANENSKVRTQPMINNMLIGVSNGTVCHNASDILATIKNILNK